MKRSATGDPPGTPSASQGASSGGATSEGPASKKRIVFEPIQLGPIANLEELEVKSKVIWESTYSYDAHSCDRSCASWRPIYLQVKTLAFQNQKLGHRLTQRIAMEEDLRSRIDQVRHADYHFYLSSPDLSNKIFSLSWRSGRRKTTLS